MGSRRSGCCGGGTGWVSGVARARKRRSLVPAVAVDSRESGGGPKVKLRLGEVLVEAIDATGVPPEWLAALVRELGAPK